METEEDDSGPTIDEVVQDTPEEPTGPRPGRVLPAVMVIATGLILLLPLLAVSVVSVAGPELLGGIDGGNVHLYMPAECGTFHARWTDCFSNATVTVSYDGHTQNVTHSPGPVGFNDVLIPLEQARATIHIEADQGRWVREVWVIDGQTNNLRIRVEDPPTQNDVLGRQIGAALFSIPLTFLAIALFGGGITWLVTGRPEHARFTGALTTLWFVIFIGLAVVTLFFAALGIGLLLVVGWFWWLRSMVRTRGAGSQIG